MLEENLKQDIQSTLLSCGLLAIRHIYKILNCLPLPDSYPLIHAATFDVYQPLNRLACQARPFTTWGLINQTATTLMSRFS